MDNPFDYSAPRPYAWKTDEFQTQNEARPQQRPTEPVKPLTNQFNPAAHQNFQPAPLAYQQTRQMGQPFRCPHCMSQYLPRIERRISTAGWITFAVLLLGRHRFGWRGKRAHRMLYLGAGLLLLAYVGSRFVLEVVLRRPG